MNNSTTGSLTKTKFVDFSVEAAIHIGLLFLLVFWCFSILRPFFIPVIWGIIIAVALYTPFSKLRSLLGGHGGLAALVFVLVALALLIIPTAMLSGSLIDSGKEIAQGWQDGTLSVPPPPESVAGWPLIGESVDEAWRAASVNLEAFVVKFQPQLEALGGSLLSLVTSLGGAVLYSVFAILLAAAFLAKSTGGIGTAQNVSRRVLGKRGEDTVRTSAATIRGVAMGVVGVAVIQAVAAGLGMLVAGVPGAGLWALFILILAVIQLPAILVLLPVMIYLFVTASTTTAVLFLVWGLLVSFSDTFLKPVLMGRGMKTPSLVLLIGSIGGMMLSGIIGLFLGAVVLALGYELFQTWLSQDLAEA